MEEIRPNNDWMKIVSDELRLRGYSEKTIRAYLYYINRYIASGRLPKEFLLELINDGKSDETVRLAGFAIKFYLRIIGKIEMISIPNIKRPKKIPEILSRDEIDKMIHSTTNLKHRLIIQLGYSAGLRLSELINLRWNNIDYQRDTIHIKHAKGKKDRIVMLSPKVKNVLNSFRENQEFVLTNRHNKKYSERTIQTIIHNAALKAGIKKKVTPHSLRHAFATHLLEKGIDIRHIKELLGHSNINTTLIYTKAAKVSIKSPIDL